MATIAFLGFGDYGACCLEGLINTHDVVLVLSHPSPSENVNVVAEIALKSRIPMRFSRTLEQMSDVDALREAAPDYLVSTNWRRKVPDSALACARLAALNVHDSLLPNYAGLSAEQWVVRNGETTTGVTVHLMTSLMDVGGIVCQREIAIKMEDCAADVARKQKAIYPELINEAIANYARPGFKPLIHKPGVYRRYHTITDHDLRINWNAGTFEILNMIRAHSDPYQNCFFMFRGKRFRLKRARRPECSYGGTPGRVVTSTSDGVAVVTGQGNDPTSLSGLVLQQVRDEDGTLHCAREVFAINAQLE